MRLQSLQYVIQSMVGDEGEKKKEALTIGNGNANLRSDWARRRCDIGSLRRNNY